ncbi:hypothetical protein N9K77_01760 [bacterium]|nr:hypothetical protein [bacterium]
MKIGEVRRDAQYALAKDFKNIVGVKEASFPSPKFHNQLDGELEVWS